MNRPPTAAGAGLIACEVCDTLARARRDPHVSQYCPRCGARLFSRIPHSLQKTWALLIAAMLLYVPANTLPVMSIVYLGKGEPSTILEGVMQLIQEGMWPLALIVFVASIFVPLLKMLALLALLISVHLRSSWRPADRTRFYRVTEFIGRWSMVDIFVIAILASLVQFGALADIEPGAGSVSFAAVVVATMFAAHSFDPRLIWDHAGE
ncbi:MAG TPA: paraquat-inducible membrane protein A [Gammaproteobacteria bacterium]|nr:paraquat-inducible membrane protein A [Gammaproteobacteria bacterium]